MSKPLEDYGLIADGETVALVARDGSIDWLCWPRFDSDACFAALLGTQEHGCWRIAPAAPCKVERRYRPDTLIMETDFHVEGGSIRLTDFMPLRNGRSAVIRVVKGLQGAVDLRLQLNLRFDYGLLSPWLTHQDGSVVAKVGPDLVVLHADVPLKGHGEVLEADFSVAQDEERVFLLIYGQSREPAPPRFDHTQALAETEAFWRDWIKRFDKKTDWPEAMRRSLLTLKALIYTPSGGMVAAPTTSLPEAPGREMNWDYRYCWLRDSTFTLSALINAGYHEEAKAWRDWLLRAVAGDPNRMRIMYRVDGGRRLEEWVADWLPGYRWTTPVRIGNAAAQQQQNDVFGEVLDTLHLAAKAGMERLERGIEFEEAIIRHVEAIWREPDQGLWESRGKPRHYLYSKVMTWVAMDRFVKGRAGDAPEKRDMLEKASRLRDLMHAEICREGYDSGLGTFVSYYGSEEIDASLLLIPIVGFLPVEDERVARTIAAVERDLVEEGFVRRSKPRSRNPEGTFLACTCWLADCQAMQHRTKEARETFERVLAIRNDLGLLSEEFDVRARRLCGNFPQALSHLALIQTGLALSGPVLMRGTQA